MFLCVYMSGEDCPRVIALLSSCHYIKKSGFLMVCVC